MTFAEYNDTIQSAIGVLVAACCDDYVNSLLNEPSMRINVARSGFKGFANMRSTELIQCARDAGLDHADNDGKVAQAITLLGDDDELVSLFATGEGPPWGKLSETEKLAWRKRYINSEIEKLAWRKRYINSMLGKEQAE